MFKHFFKCRIYPGDYGKYCSGNGENGNQLLCDECDYLICCVEKSDYKNCHGIPCPRKGKTGKRKSPF